MAIELTREQLLAGFPYEQVNRLANVPPSRKPAVERSPSTAPWIETTNPKQRAGAGVMRQRVGTQFRYTMGKRYTSNRETWTRHMVTTAQAHTDTLAATQAHIASGKYPTKRLHWSWMIEQGYIVKES